MQYGFEYQEEDSIFADTLVVLPPPQAFLSQAGIDFEYETLNALGLELVLLPAREAYVSAFGYALDEFPMEAGTTSVISLLEMHAPFVGAYGLDKSYVAWPVGFDDEAFDVSLDYPEFALDAQGSRIFPGSSGRISSARMLIEYRTPWRAVEAHRAMQELEQ